MPTGMLFKTPVSVLLSIFSGLAKASTTRFTAGFPEPSARSISQWLLWSNSVMSRTRLQSQKWLPQSQTPKTEIGLSGAGVGVGPGGVGVGGFPAAGARPGAAAIRLL